MRIKTLLIMLFFLVPLTIKAEPRVTDIGAAKYYTSENVEENNLPNGVIHYAHKGFTSAKEGEVTDMGMNVTETFVPDKFYPQTINMLEIPASSNVKLIPWAVIEDSGWKLKTVREIAADFEKHHLGKKVIAGVNGDFFDIQGGKMYPYTPHSAHASEGNHFKSITHYRALGFKNDHSTTPLVGNKAIERNSLPTLEILNEYNEVLLSFPIDKVNEEPIDLELSLLYPTYGITSNGGTPKSQPINVTDSVIINATHALPITNVQAVYGYESDSLDFYGKGFVERLGSGSIVGNRFALKTSNQAVLDVLKKIQTSVFSITTQERLKVLITLLAITKL